MKALRLVTLLGCVFLLGACDRFREEGVSSGVYEYVAFNGDQDVIVQGQLMLNFAPTDSAGTTVSGEWDLLALVDVALVGPQSGSGNLDGFIGQNGNIRIDLSPDRTDLERVILVGQATEEGGLSGSWVYLSQTARTGGVFEAVRIAGASVPHAGGMP